ncbi:MAG: long-chain acyl-CoA synthetase [Thermoplasmata archaeon]|nr:long-chain acyl-CoA synthetase [Thermoplasmata archaeon]
MSATLASLYWDSVQANGEKAAQGWHDGEAWRSRSFHAMGQAVRDTAHALLAAGLKKGDRVAIWSRNCPQWAEVDFANLTAGFVTVPIYDTLTGEKAAYILDDAEAKVLFVQDAGILARFLPVRKALKHLQTVVVFGPGPGQDAVAHADFVAAGRAWGRKNPDKLDAIADKVAPQDLASIVYTSGTTGEPKGAMLSHGNFASNATAALTCVQITPEDVFLSFLPLSHVFERTAGHFAAYAAGAQVVYARSIDTLAEDMVSAQPTLMMAVPRLYEKLHAKVQAKVAEDSFVKRAIFNWAMGVGRQSLPYIQQNQEIPKGLQSKLKRADKLVFRKLKARVGGRLRYFVSGGAALSKDIEEFFWSAGIQILQGYGLTETSPVTNVNRPGAIRFGSVGPVIPGVECRIDISDWPQGMRPFPEGEICFKGPNVMQGYWRNPKATKECMDKDGWFHTGDIGYLDGDGFLWITDRKKEIIVMSNGKKVPPQPIENALKLQPHIAQACVLGEGRNYVATLVVPDWEAIDRFALENGIAAKDHDRLAADPRVVSLIEREVEAVNARLARYEQVKKFWIVPGEWSVESGELTPTLKLRRRIIQQKFASSIDKLYPVPVEEQVA